MDLAAVWNSAAERVKQEVVQTTLWQALEAAVPIAADDGTFVIGFGPTDYHLSGHLLVSEYKIAIERALKEFAGRAFEIRVIEGITEDDWAAAKDKDERKERIRRESYEKERDQAERMKAWEKVLEAAGRRYANLPYRALPQFRAKYVAEMLKHISDAMDELMPEGNEIDEISERSLARVIERVASLAETPPAVIAIELLRYRSAKRTQ